MNELTSPADIRPDHLEIVQDILREHLSDGFKVWVFGSRANWTTKDSSDLDLAVEGSGTLDYKAMVGLEVAFEESDLPYTVDVVDLNAVSPSFKKIVEGQRVPLPSFAASRTGNIGGHKVALDDVVTLQLSSVDKKSKANERAVRLCNYTDVYNNSFIHADMDFVEATATEREIAKCSLVVGDVIITKDSEKHDDIGVPALVREDIPNLVCGYHLAILRPCSSEVDGTYLFYALSTGEAQEQFHSYANGITRFGLRKADIGLVEIPLPPLPEQRAIAHILGTLDDKIELNRRMNQTLEELARAIFQDWFVDFGPVRAKLECREPYLPPEFWDLFPDRLVDSELGEIPEGWEVKALADCLVVARGLSYKGSGLSSYGIPMHNLNSIYEGGGYKDDGIKFYNGDFQNRHVTQPGDVLVANTEQGHDRLLIGFAAIVPQRFGDNGLFSHHIYRVRPKGSCSLSPDFVCQLLNTKATHDTVSGYATGTTVNMLPVDALRFPGIVVPPARLVTSFSAMADTVRSRQEELIGESRSLAALRDVLLPKLVSGEVRVGDAENQVETIV